ncbi:MAG: hypothetical protein WAO19_06625 [Candidatus Kryptoniota bacterium]
MESSYHQFTRGFQTTGEGNPTLLLRHNQDRTDSGWRGGSGHAG